MDMAVLHPEINYVGIEMYDSVTAPRSTETGKTGDGNRKTCSLSAWMHASFRKCLLRAR